MAKESSRSGEIPEKVWLPWVQEGPYLVRHQHLVARDEGEVSLCPVPLGRQVRGLAKATLQELRASIPPDQLELANQIAQRLAQGRPWRLVAREFQGRGHAPEKVLDALMALCRAGLVVVFFRNRRRCEAQWEARHVELTNWGKALLISIEAVTVPIGRLGARAQGHGASRPAPQRPGSDGGDGGSGSEDSPQRAPVAGRRGSLGQEGTGPPSGSGTQG